MVEKYYQEFLHRVQLNFQRMSSDTYKMEKVFREKEYDWEGDWEGRALLAFVCQYRLTGQIIATMPYEIENLPLHTNKIGYFGEETDGKTISEQLLSGNGWFLRALCEYYTEFGGEHILSRIQNILNNLYFRCEKLYDNYPMGNRNEEGGVSGNLTQMVDGWNLSTDVGCAFIALDGLTAAYKLLHTPALKAFIDKRIEQFMHLDKRVNRMQTHATNTVNRAILRMYFITKEKKYLQACQELFALYVRTGMTLTFENFNWFERKDTWTEPCAVIDSLIVAMYLYKATGQAEYLTWARRIYFNGFRLEQRCNGGAGTNDCVTTEHCIWKAQMFEAEFCCSMRTAEGLWQISLFAEELFAENDENKQEIVDDYGRHFKGDHLLYKTEKGVWVELPNITEYSVEELKKVNLEIIEKKEKTFLSGSKTYNTIQNHVNAPIFKRVFKRDQILGVTLHIETAGFYRVFVNDVELTKGFLAPYICNPDHLVYFDEYNLDGILQKGENTLYVLLGNGFSNALDGGVWDFEKAEYRSAPKFYLALADAKGCFLQTDEHFVVSDSPILFDDIRCGERYDARMEAKVGNKLYTGIRERKPIKVQAPKGEVKKCTAQAIRAVERMTAKEIIPVEGGYIYDFGVNHAGLGLLHITAKEGQEVDLTFGEVFLDGQLRMESISFGDRNHAGYIQHEKYICKEGEQEYLPSFTYHGFRYVYIEGVTEEQANVDLLTYVVIHSDIPSAATFTTNDEMLTKIQECVLRSDVSNFHYFPTDCPQREKNGWTGDINVSAEQLMYNLNCEDSLAEWLNNVRAVQKENGALPGIVPTGGWGFTWGNGPAWDGALIEVTYQLYRFTGKIEHIQENKYAIAKYIDYLTTKKREDGLIGFGLGDWCEPGFRTEDGYSTPVYVSDTLTCIDFLGKAYQMFTLAGEQEFADKAKGLQGQLKEAFCKQCIDGAEVYCKSQTAQAMAIELGLFNDKEEQAYEYLLSYIRRDNDRLHTGILGTKWLFPCLCKRGDADLAYSLIADPRYPSYGYMINHGATTLWEGITEWEEEVYPNQLRRKDGGRILSFNHHFWGSVSATFFEHFAGLCVVDCNTVKIQPKYIKALNFARASYTRNGKSIVVYWERGEGEIKLVIENHGFSGSINGGSELLLQEGLQEYHFSL